MSYVENISPEDFGDYEIVQDWNVFYQDFRAKTDVVSLKSNGLEVRKKIIQSDVQLIGSYFDFAVRFEYCYFEKSLSFSLSTFDKRVVISNCFIDESLDCGMCSFNDNFSIFSTAVKKDLHVLNSTFGESTWDIKECHRCFLMDSTFGKLEFIIIEDTFNELWVGRIKGQFDILGNNNIVNNFYIIGLSNSLTLTIKNILVDKINILGYRNDGALRLSNVQANPNNIKTEFSIGDSYLGKAEFYLIDFSRFSSVRIVDTYIVDCVFVNVTWADKIQAFKGSFEESDDDLKLQEKIFNLEKRTYLNIGEKNSLENDIDVLLYYSKQRESLRQIKYALSKQGDLLNEQRFHALEMRAYDKSLTYRKNFWIKIIIKFSRDTSDFGQSIHKPLLGLLIGHFCLFSILILGNIYKPLHFSLTAFDLAGFWTGFHHYFETINPLRKVDESFVGGYIFIDILMRIWSSYMIYNMIRATRRFIK